MSENLEHLEKDLQELIESVIDGVASSEEKQRLAELI